jgi:hypothetical protein
MSAGKCTVERYEQDRNLFILLIANEREFCCCGSIIERNGPLRG